MNKKCYIVGAGDNSGTKFNKKENEYVIAADGGLAVLENMGIIPDVIIGDFDSLGYNPKGDHVIKYAVEKDDTDMMLAIKYALDNGYNDLEIYGGTGGRFDHTIANIQTMLYASQHGASVKMIDSSYEYFVITDSILELPPQKSATFSVFALGDIAEGIGIYGGKYELDDGLLSASNPMGVSNSYIGDKIRISVKKGSLLIISEREK